MQVYAHYVRLVEIQWIFTAKVIAVGEHIGSQEFVS